MKERHLTVLPLKPSRKSHHRLSYELVEYQTNYQLDPNLSRHQAHPAAVIRIHQEQAQVLPQHKKRIFYRQSQKEIQFLQRVSD